MVGTYLYKTSFSLALLMLVVFANASLAATDPCGPINLLKTMPTPFSPPVRLPANSPNKHTPSEMSISVADCTLKLPISSAIETSTGSGVPAVKPIAAPRTTSRSMLRKLSDQLLDSRLYLPGRLILGKPAEFTVKGRRGSYVALAMADKPTGAKPIYGHRLRLGADRKVVSVGQIPETGVLTLVIDTPLQGDLIGLAPVGLSAMASAT